jgi:hypothetical protein
MAVNFLPAETHLTKFAENSFSLLAFLVLSPETLQDRNKLIVHI